MQPSNSTNAYAHLNSSLEAELEAAQVSLRHDFSMLNTLQEERNHLQGLMQQNNRLVTERLEQNTAETVRVLNRYFQHKERIQNISEALSKLEQEATEARHFRSLSR